MAWYGYTVSGAGPYTAVTASWTVPTLNTVSSTAPSNALLWVGLDGLGNNTVEQCGIATFVDPGGTARYQAWAEYYPSDEEWFSPTAYPVAAGDSVTASAAYSSALGGSYTLTVIDSTQGWTASTTKTASALAVQNGTLPTLQSAEVIIEADQPENVMADFGVVTFTGITGLGTAPSFALQGTQASLSGWNNNSFPVTWDHT